MIPPRCPLFYFFRVGKFSIKSPKRFLFHLTSSVTGSAALKHGFLSYRLLRMNVQGCHNILAICSHIEFEKMTASGPVHHPLKTYTFFFMTLTIRVSFIIISSPRSVTNSGSAWGYPPPPRLAKNKKTHTPRHVIYGWSLKCIWNWGMFVTTHKTKF